MSVAYFAVSRTPIIRCEVALSKAPCNAHLLALRARLRASRMKARAQYTTCLVRSRFFDDGRDRSCIYGLTPLTFRIPVSFMVSWRYASNRRANLMRLTPLGVLGILLPQIIVLWALVAINGHRLDRALLCNSEGHATSSPSVR